MSNFDAIRKRLVQRKQELESILSEIYREQAPEQTQDTGDAALSASLEDLKISLHNNELAEYKMVLKAIDMIDEGTYGICVECGRPISEKRLAIFPNSTRCISCQEALEENRSY